jgi:hypothetical protein
VLLPVMNWKAKEEGRMFLIMSISSFAFICQLFHLCIASAAFHV